MRRPIEALAAGARRSSAEAATRVEHRLHLARRPGQQDDDGDRRPVEQQPRGAAVRVVEHGGAARHHRLAAVDRRHAQAALREARLDLGDDRRVLVQRQAEHLGDDVARQVVVGRPEPAGEDDEVGALERLPEDRRQIGAAIADDRLGAQVDAERREAVRRGTANWCRSRVEPSISLPTAMISAERSGASELVMRTMPEAGTPRPRSARFA